MQVYTATLNVHSLDPHFNEALCWYIQRRLFFYSPRAQTSSDIYIYGSLPLYRPAKRTARAISLYPRFNVPKRFNLYFFLIYRRACAAPYSSRGSFSSFIALYYIYLLVFVIYKCKVKIHAPRRARYIYFKSYL